MGPGEINIPFFITDENNEVLAVLDDNSSNFEEAGVGICRVWGVAYSGNLTVNPGDNATQVLLSDDCFDLSANFITVDRQEVKGGTVAMPSGATERRLCIGDDESDIVRFTNTNSIGTSYGYIITDDQNTILGATTSSQQNFGGAGSGICRVWGLAYTGELTVEEGTNLNRSDLSSICYDLSENFIEITRIEVDGGSVALENGETETSICVDAPSNVLTATHVTTANANYIYLVTDDNSELLTSSEDGSIDLTGAPVGICRIYGLSYTGSLSIETFQNITSSTLSDDCFDLSSNFITVIRDEVKGGAISLENNSSPEIEVCVNDGVPDPLNFINEGAIGTSFIYVVTDENNTILLVSESNEINFEESGVGVCRVWGLSYTGNLIAEVGQVASEADLADECFALTDNFVAVIRTDVEGGTLSFSDGSDEISLCVDTGNPNPINVFVIDASTANDYAYLITDEAGELLQISDSNALDFDGAGPGTCLVFGVAYTGSLSVEEGDDVMNSVLSDQCYTLSDNALRVNRFIVEGGEVLTTEGETEVEICPGDSREDIIRFDNSSSSGPSYAYIITDEQNSILGILDSVNFQDFNTAPAGICRVWGLAYDGNIIAETGQDAASVDLTDVCFDLSDNFVTVFRRVPQGGTVSTTDGLTELNTCPGDGNADIVSFTNQNAEGDNYIYLITNEDNIVLAIEEGDSFDFEDAGVGICRVWGLAYKGDLLVVVGDNVDISVLSTDCSSLSENFIQVTRAAPEGGMFTLEDGTTFTSICTDENPNFLNFDLQGQIGSNYVFIILDISNEQTVNTIVGFTDSTAFDFNTLPGGTYSVVGVAYEGELNFIVGNNFNEVSQNLATDCFSISESAVTITVTSPDAGNIIAPNPNLDLCTGDQNADDDIVSFSTDAQSIAFSKYLLTDENDVLILALDESSINFGELPTGNYRIRSMSFTGTFTLVPEDNILTATASTDCWDISENFIAVSNTMVEGGTIGSPLATNDQVFTCDDEESDIISFSNNSEAGADYAYILTDESGFILIQLDGNEQDFNNTGFRELKVWGLSYTGELNVISGDIITEVQLSDGCFDLSSNAISIFSDEPDGGSISNSEGETAFSLCVEPENPFLNMATTSTSDLGYVYFLTDTMNTVISAFDMNEIDFSEILPGVYHIWGASYSGSLNDLAGQNIETAVVSTSCFELSSNFVFVNRESNVDGGTLSNINGETTVYACPGGGGADIVVIRTSSEDENYRLFITDDDGNVIVPDIGGNVIPFDGAAPGIYRIWGLSFNGTLDLDFGDNIFENELADSCFVLSSNDIRVVNELPDGGIVSTLEGATSVNVMVGDGLADSIFFSRETTSPNALYTYVITTEDNNILGYAENVQDFEATDPGVYRVWGVAYTGELTGQLGGIATDVAIADDCFDLSDNFIQINAATQGGIVDSETFYQAPISKEGEYEGAVKVNLLPNPTSIDLTIQLIGGKWETSNSNIQIHNVSGELLDNYTMPTHKGLSEYTINVEHLPSGLYLLQLNNGKWSKSLRFAKQ